jgi:hypothetical protein
MTAEHDTEWQTEVTSNARVSSTKFRPYCANENELVSVLIGQLANARMTSLIVSNYHTFVVD